jgi:hypothetical protein
VGFAYVPQAAESLASDSLRIPRVSHAGGLLLSADGFAAQTKMELQIKMPACAGILYSGGERGIRINAMSSICAASLEMLAKSCHWTYAATDYESKEHMNGAPQSPARQGTLAVHTVRGFGKFLRFGQNIPQQEILIRKSLLLKAVIQRKPIPVSARL